MEYFLFLLAGLMFVDFLVYLVIANFYTYSNNFSSGNDEQEDVDDLTLTDSDKSITAQARADKWTFDNGHKSADDREIQL